MLERVGQGRDRGAVVLISLIVRRGAVSECGESWIVETV